MARSRWTRTSLACASGVLLAALAACSGGGGGGPFFPGGGQGPTPRPTAAPTAVPTSCATGTPGPASGAAVFYLNTSCSTANTQFGFTVAGDANGTLIAASTVDESVPLANGSVQSPPPADTLGVNIAAGDVASSASRAGNARLPVVDLRGVRSSVRTSRRFAHARPVPNRKLASLLLASTRGTTVKRKPAILSTTLGATTGIWTLNTSGNYIQVPSTLSFTSAHGDVWVDNSLLSANGGPLTTAAVQTIGADYDNAWASDTQHIGTPDYTASSIGAQETTTCIDGQTQVPIFIPDADQRQAVFIISSSSNGGFGSYFDPANLIFNDVAMTCLGAESNERSGIYVQYTLGNANDTQTQQLQEDDVVLTANDLTHLVDFVGHTITNPGNDSNATFLATGYIDSPFIIEGLASLSEDFAAVRMFPQLSFDVDDNLQSAQTYLAGPSNYELTAFFGTDPNSPSGTACSGCFGSAYLFARYAFDRFGANYPGAIVNSGVTGFANLQQAFGAATAPQNVVGDFAVAMAASGQRVTSDSRFNVAGFTTRGTFTDQFGTTLELTGPAAAATQTVGADTQYTTNVGSFLYLTLGGLPAPATVSVTDGSGAFGLAAALDQH